ncbi:conserved protein of unknown function [Acidithiobacillus ferrivorans]|uniref:Uncharacterized protein n=1 Tax=Acidithiobacillus ferrivorans TaxID=160808 RepID=A0A060UQV9_9PROT|nr:hypothetical protein [Acidithiobacillus ferrivorans]CDQ09193.1 conserved hypothetical protein [Acidithiobacillus ferrivorans]SMH64862.1 conserved protein of unknown function [Acidithiobacillus ferrivorans]
MTIIETGKDTQWVLAVNGTESIRFIVVDAGKDYPNDRYTIILDAPITHTKSRMHTYPYIAMNSLGMFYHGEVDYAYIEALIREDIKGERVISWDDLNKDCRLTARAQLRAYLEPLSMAG